jgi:uncharacterized protein (TIGR02421 family)
VSVTRTDRTKPTEITDRFIRGVTARLSENKRVRRRLPVWGRVHIDRALPFVCVYRQPRHHGDEGTDRLATTEAAYLNATGLAAHHAGLSRLIRGIAETMSGQFGAYLILELWALPSENDRSPDENDGVPGFRIVVPPDKRLDALAGFFETALKRIKLKRKRAEVTMVRSHRCHPRRMAPVLSAEVMRETGCIVVGLGVRPVYRDASGEQLYPLRLRPFRRQLSRALKRTFFEFSRSYTTHRPKHYHMLGRRAVVKAVWDSDRQLGDVADVFDLLLQTTPVNARQAWIEFRRTRFEKAPSFRYRPVPVDPAILKRHLFAAPLERVEDPALALLLRQKQNELDRQITMLLDLNTRRFLHGSLQLYGGVGDGLANTAVEILQRLPSRTREDTGKGHLDAQAFARRAKEEVAWYRKQWPALKATVQVRSDVNSGLLVSRGSLLVGSHTRIPVSRVIALLQHEVGTHVLTYYNGKAQPFRQLYSGLAGYETLQEGLAVLAEYLVGGLSRPRLRLLAARVLVVRLMVDGATFVDCYRRLNGEYGLAQYNAYTVTMRVFRGGGLTKDAIYLRGLDQLLGYLHDGSALDPLFVGKIATEHIPIIEELTWRGVLHEPPLTPRYMNQPDTIARLERVRRYESVLDFVKEEYR